MPGMSNFNYKPVLYIGLLASAVLAGGNFILDKQNEGKRSDAALERLRQKKADKPASNTRVTNGVTTAAPTKVMTMADTAPVQPMTMPAAAPAPTAQPTAQKEASVATPQVIPGSGLTLDRQRTNEDEVMKAQLKKAEHLKQLAQTELDTLKIQEQIDDIRINKKKKEKILKQHQQQVDAAGSRAALSSVPQEVQDRLSNQQAQIASLKNEVKKKPTMLDHARVRLITMLGGEKEAKLVIEGDNGSEDYTVVEGQKIGAFWVKSIDSNGVQFAHNNRKDDDKYLPLSRGTGSLTSNPSPQPVNNTAPGGSFGGADAPAPAADGSNQP